MKTNQNRSFSTMERRRFIRIVQGSPLTFITSKGISGEGELVDLSLRGLRFQSEVALNEGDKIRAVFILSNGISLDLTGFVVHRQIKPKKSIYGIEFSIQDYRDLKEHLKLNNYIIHARVEQDQMIKKEFLKRKDLPT